MTTLTKQQTSLALQLAIVEGGLTEENVTLQRTRPLVTTMFSGIPTELIIQVGNEELAKLEAMIEKEAMIDEAKTGVRPSNNDLEARWGLRTSPQFESTKSNNINKVKIAINVASVVAGLILRKKMADHGMVRSFWYGLPHKPGTFPKNK